MSRARRQSALTRKLQALSFDLRSLCYVARSGWGLDLQELQVEAPTPTLPDLMRSLLKDPGPVAMDTIATLSGTRGIRLLAAERVRLLSNRIAATGSCL